MKLKLNEMQLKAVAKIDGPLLIIAGAGSGKTRTLVERIANIIRRNKACPSEIMAVTFTNKAAKELTDRIVSEVGAIGKTVFAGTFHSICARILRKHSRRLGYESNFVIYDTDDKLKVIKSVIKGMELSPSFFPYKKIASIISNLKNKLIYPENYNEVSEDFFFDKIKDIYSAYQEELIRCNAFDFDDLLCMAVKLFMKNEDVLFEYQNRIKYICVDEYQDTNFVQDKFVSMISELYGNVCVVGDEDQSIYSWRGADINNILSFKERYRNCELIQLEENYRSTSNILKTANSVISKNVERLGKNLFTASGNGDRIKLFSSETDIDEGRIVTSEISKLIKQNVSLSEICVLYRTNAQSRIIEDNLRKSGLPYTIVGGLKFYERKEIKDITAYLRLLLNKNDNVSFERIINFPPRGIGKKTIEKIKYDALTAETSYFDALKSSGLANDNTVSGRKIKNFINLIDSLSENADKYDARQISEIVLKDSKLADYYSKQSDSAQDSSRIDNLYEFLNGVSDFVKTEINSSLQDFLTSVSLLSDIDTYNDSADRIVLMTVHSAKGLEFDNVFITGMNEGLFPYIHHAGESVNTEEERRLFYVAITRTRKRLYISSYRNRNRYFGNNGSYIPSKFLEDLPDDSVDRSGFEKYDRDQLKFDRLTRYESSAVNSEPEYEIRDLVMSKQFGEGIILHIEESGRKKIVTVDFDDFGIKKLLVRYADLKKL
jgi:DNA helicase-2/ATP-dependent DNA helicase PcrA